MISETYNMLGLYSFTVPLPQVDTEHAQGLAVRSVPHVGRLFVPDGHANVFGEVGLEKTCLVQARGTRGWPALKLAPELRLALALACLRLLLTNLFQRLHVRFTRCNQDIPKNFEIFQIGS